MIYTAKIHGANCSITREYTTDNYEQVITWVKEDLEDCGGGTAEICKVEIIETPIDEISG